MRIVIANFRTGQCDSRRSKIVDLPILMKYLFPSYSICRYLLATVQVDGSGTAHMKVKCRSTHTSSARLPLISQPCQPSPPLFLQSWSTRLQLQMLLCPRQEQRRTLSHPELSPLLSLSLHSLFHQMGYLALVAAPASARVLASAPCLWSRDGMCISQD